MERVLNQSLQRAERMARRVLPRRWWLQGRWLGLSVCATVVDDKLLLPLVLSSLAYSTIAVGRPFSLAAIAPRSRRLSRSLLHLARTPLGAGTLAFASTYALAAAWSELDGNWAAVVLTGLALLNGLLLLQEMVPRAQGGRSPVAGTSWEGQWQNLSAASPLQRLMAVRSLLHRTLDPISASTAPIPAVYLRSHLADCFQVMLAQEADPIVRRALQEGLQMLQPAPQLPEGQPAIAPLSTTTTALTPTAKRIVEYVDPSPIA